MSSYCYVTKYLKIEQTIFRYFVQSILLHYFLFCYKIESAAAKTSKVRSISLKTLKICTIKNSKLYLQQLLRRKFVHDDIFWTYSYV